MRREEHIHFMGVGGIGVSALAEMALRAGYRVSGCDNNASALTQRLESEGMSFMTGHDSLHVKDVDLLVYSSAIPADHPERQAAGARQMPRGKFLARSMEDLESWGVSGTHGKTTTTWLVAHLAIAAGLDPTVFIGGLVSDLPGGNYRLGTGPFIAELDESDASFLYPRLDLAVITNIESDHLSHYGNDEALFEAFRSFAKGVQDRGLVIVCRDNPMALEISTAHEGRMLSFGLSPDADIMARDIRLDKDGSRFNVAFNGVNLGDFFLPLPGRHNILNALAALGAMLNREIDVEVLRGSLATIKGVGRRFELLGEFHGAVLYSDYAHHPTEVAATIDAVRQRHQGKLLVVFQPHLYTRTRDYHEEFGAALANSDAVIVADIYPAREEPIPGVTSELIVKAVRKKNGNILGPIPIEALEFEVLKVADGFDAVVYMGAGNIDSAARKLAARKKERR